MPATAAVCAGQSAADRVDGQAQGLHGPAADLPVRLGAAYGQFREALKLARSEAADTISQQKELAELRCTALQLHACSRACHQTEVCMCHVLAAEAAKLGSDRALALVRHIHTVAQAACFLHRTTAWIAAREQATASICKAPSTCERHDAEFQLGEYVPFDGTRYDFCTLVSRIFAEQLLTIESSCGALRDDVSQGARLERLHESEVGRREPGFLSSADEWSTAGRVEYSRVLDEATRYGCGVFNRIFKASPLRVEFLALYERFIAEVVAPMLGSAEGLIYQAEPVFRVYLPGHLTVGPRHTDASYHTQPNELNFWVPLTAAFGSNSLQVESRPGAADFEPITCEFGTMFRFRGNACEHFTELNVSGATRVSFDFRVIRTQEIGNCPVPLAPTSSGVKGAAAYFSIGRYYKRLEQP